MEGLRRSVLPPAQPLPALVTSSPCCWHHSVPELLAEAPCVGLDSGHLLAREGGVGDCHVCELTHSENPGRMNYVPSMDCLFLLVLKTDDFMK